MTGHEHAEQRVRVMAGWVGVDISRSRVRTSGRPGYGLYRVRTSAERHWHVGQPPVVPAGEWTPYAFTLDELRTAVERAIEAGTPEGPGALTLSPSRPVGYRVPARWTSAYRGPRDLGVQPNYHAAGGVEPYRGPGSLFCEDCAMGEAPCDEHEPIPVQLRPEVHEEVHALVTALDAGQVEMRHDAEWCGCTGTDRLTMACIRLTQKAIAANV